MDVTKIEAAVERLERNLPIRRNQTRLDEPLRQLHRRILRHYLERGVARADGDPDGFGDWQGGVDRLAAEQIIVVDETGSIIGAYPFVEEAREFRVVTRFGAVNAMCAFDALAVAEPGEPVFAAIDWNAAGGTGSCALNLCTEMIFIAGDARAAEWCGEDTDKRELFALPEAHAIIAQIFMPLMR
jgi:hypothetical protein